MKFTKEFELNDFLRTIEECEGEVWFESPQGDKFVLKSLFSKYLCISALIKDHRNDLELFCQLPSDEARFFKYFGDHPEVV